MYVKMEVYANSVVRFTNVVAMGNRAGESIGCPPGFRFRRCLLHLGPTDVTNARTCCWLWCVLANTMQACLEQGVASWSLCLAPPPSMCLCPSQTSQPATTPRVGPPPPPAPSKPVCQTVCHHSFIPPRWFFTCTRAIASTNICCATPRSSLSLGDR